MVVLRNCHLRTTWWALFRTSLTISLALSLGGTKEFAQVDMERITRFAEKAGLPVRIVLKTARETVAATRDLWPKHEPLLALPDRIRTTIPTHMERVPL